MEKEYYVDFTGWFKIRAKDKDEAQEKFWKLVYTIRKETDLGPDDHWDFDNCEEVW